MAANDEGSDRLELVQPVNGPIGITADGIYDIHPATTHVHATYLPHLPTTAPTDQCSTADVNKHPQVDVAAIDRNEQTQVKTETEEADRENNGQTDETTHVKARLQEDSDDNLQTELPSATVETDDSNNGSNDRCIEALENRTAEAADHTAGMLTAADYCTDTEFKDIYAYLSTGELTGDNKTDKKTLLLADQYFIEMDGYFESNCHVK